MGAQIHRRRIPTSWSVTAYLGWSAMPPHPHQNHINQATCRTSRTTPHLPLVHSSRITPNHPWSLLAHHTTPRLGAASHLARHIRAPHIAS
eukprot:6601717-Pyramimonas_sp.AAC.1